MPFNLPRNFNVDLPDLQNLTEGAIGTPESGFAPGENIARTSKNDRELHKQIYEEQRNTIENLKDGIRLVNTIVQAGVDATVLGQTLLKYQTGLENIRNEGVKLQKAQTQTAISQAELLQLQAKLNFEGDKLPLLNRGYAAKLETLQIQAEMAEREAENMLIERDTRYPRVDVQAIAA